MISISLKNLAVRMNLMRFLWLTTKPDAIMKTKAKMRTHTHYQHQNPNLDLSFPFPT